MNKQDVVMQRHANVTPGISLTNSTTSTSAIRNDLHEHTGYMFTAHATAQTATYWVSADNVTYKALYNASNSAVTQAVTANRAYPLAAEAKPWPYVKLVLDAGTATITVARKS